MNTRKYHRKRNWTYIRSFIITTLVCMIASTLIVFCCTKVDNREVKAAKEYAFMLYNDGLNEFNKYTVFKEIQLEFTDAEDLEKFYKQGLKYVNHTDLDKFQLTGNYMWDKIIFEDGKLKFYDSTEFTYIVVSTQLYYEDDIKQYVYSEHINVLHLIFVLIFAVLISLYIWFNSIKKILDERFDTLIDRDIEYNYYENDNNEDYEDYEDYDEDELQDESYEVYEDELQYETDELQEKIE